MIKLNLADIHLGQGCDDGSDEFIYVIFLIPKCRVDMLGKAPFMSFVEPFHNLASCLDIFTA